MKVFQFICNNKVVTEVFVNFNGRNSLIMTRYSSKEELDFDINKYKTKKEIGIEDFDEIKIVYKDYYKEIQTLPIIIKKLEKLNNISKVRWLSRFEGSFSQYIWNGHYQREEKRLQKELEEYKALYPFTFSEAIHKCNCQKYIISRNHHNNRIGLNTDWTPEGGGTIAQTDNYKDTMKIAFEVYGINHYFIH